MADLGSTLLIIFIVYGCIDGVDAIRCFKCKSSEFPDKCGDHFRLNANDTKFIVENCDNCLKTVFTDSKLIIRNCTESDRRSVSYRSGCHKEKISGTEINTCACTKDLCNSSEPYFSLTHWLLLCFGQIMLITSFFNS